MRSGQPRTAVTLMEVLVATFILSIGLISVIAMFPVGAKNMVDAIKNERTAQAAHNFDALMRVAWKDMHMTRDGSLIGSAPLFLSGFDLAPDSTNSAPRTIQGDPNGPSSPLYIDPLGYNTQATYNGAAYADRIGGRTDFIQRIGYPSLTQLNLRFAALPDDMSFSANGEPVVAGGQLDRGYRYNVAYMLQRPVNSNIYEANLWVLVFDGRPYNDVASFETIFDGGLSQYAYVDSSTVRIDYGMASGGSGVKPPLRKGGWVMITTRIPYTYQPAGSPAPFTTFRWQVEFVRVASLDDESSTVIRIGTEKPITNPGAYQQRLVVFEHLAEVFTRGKVSPNIGQVW